MESGRAPQHRRVGSSSSSGDGTLGGWRGRYPRPGGWGGRLPFLLWATTARMVTRRVERSCPGTGRRSAAPRPAQAWRWKLLYDPLAAKLAFKCPRLVRCSCVSDNVSTGAHIAGWTKFSRVRPCCAQTKLGNAGTRVGSLRF